MLTLFRNRGLTVKMMSGFALTALITLSVGWLGVVRVDRSIASVEALYQRHMQAVSDLTGGQIELLRALMGQKNALVAYTPEQRESHINGMRTSLRALEETLRRIGSASKDSGDRKLHAELETRRGTFQDVCEQIVSKLASNQAEEAFTLSMGASLTAYDEMQRALEDLVAQRRPQIAREYEQSLARSRRARVVLLILSALGCLLALGAGVAIARSVARPVAGVVEGLEHLEAGDLTRKLRVHSADEIGRLAHTYNTFVGRIGELLSEVQVATTRVGDAVSAMTGAARQTRSASAGPTIQETAQAMSRIAAASERNAQLARDAAAQFSTAQNNATRGRESVEQMLQAVAGIHESSRTISNITKVVDEIAFQTRLLALNAAVEAAHAGEEGKGFNVVAEEVRRLADRSAAAAKDIKRLIEESVSRADAGREVAVRTGAVLEELGTGIDCLSGLVAQVSDSSTEQRTEVQSAVAAINAIDATMRENGRDVERLRELVAYFQVG